MGERGPHVLSFDGSFRSRSFWITSSISLGSQTSPSGVLVTSAISRRLAPTPKNPFSALPGPVPGRDLLAGAGRSVLSSSDCELWLVPWPTTVSSSSTTRSHGSDADESVRRPKRRALDVMRRSVAMPLFDTETVEEMEGAREGAGDAERAGRSMPMPMSGVRLRDASANDARGSWTAGLACGDARTSDVEESERCRGKLKLSNVNCWGGKGEAGVTEMWGLVIWLPGTTAGTGTGPAGPAGRVRGYE